MQVKWRLFQNLKWLVRQRIAVERAIDLKCAHEEISCTKIHSSKKGSKIKLSSVKATG